MSTKTRMPGVAIFVYGFYDMDPLAKALREQGFSATTIVDVTPLRWDELARAKRLMNGMHIVLTFNLNDAHLATCGFRQDSRWIEMQELHDPKVQMTEFLMKLRIKTS